MKGIPKIHRLFAVICAFTVFLCSCGNRTESSSTQTSDTLPTIVVGCDNYPPFSYTDTNGKPTGLDTELATEAFRRMGYQAEFITIDWENKKELLEDGSIDCIWCCFSMEGRTDQYNWAGPYMLSRQVIAVNPDSDIYTLQQLENKTVAVQATTKPEELFLSQENSNIPKVKSLFSMQNRELIYPMLSKGYVDAIAAHETSLQQYMNDYHVEYRILDEPLLTVGLGVAFSLDDNRGLDKELSATLEEMRKDGTSEEIIGQYLEHPSTYLEVEDYEVK